MATGVLIVANLVVMGLSADALHRSRQLYKQQAQTQTQNIASALEQNIVGSVDKIDLALRTVTDELERQLAGKGIDPAAMDTFLARQQQRLPEVEAFRVAQADGLVFLGRGLQPAEHASWADRDYFIFLRDHPEGGLQISKPLMGRVAKQAIIAFTRRYNHPDGRFAGVVAAPIAVSYFSGMLSQFDLGPKGSIILRGTDMGLVTRVPPVPDKVIGQLGNTTVSDEFRRNMDSGVRTATYFSANSTEGLPRMVTFIRLSKAPMVIIVTTAQDDYLTPWTQELHRTLAMVASFALLSLLLGCFLLRSFRQTEIHRQQLSDGQAFVRDVIDSLPEHIAVVDAHGVIIEVNQAWRYFAQRNGAAHSHAYGVGANYFDVCQKASEQGGDTEASAFAAGLRSVLNGSCQEFIQEAACHSPNEQRWFILHAVPLRGALKGAVLIYQNTTERKLMERELRHAKAIVDSTDDAVISKTLQGIITSWNRGAENKFGYTAAEAIGNPMQMLIPSERAGEEPGILARLSAGERIESFETVLCHKDGRLIDVSVTISPIVDAVGQVVAVSKIARDITERKQFEAAQQIAKWQLEAQLAKISGLQVLLQEQAIHDPLTGLFNRRYLNETLPRELSRAKREDQLLTLVMLDLDHFKAVNDTYGHAAGDEVLRTMSGILTHGARESDTVCRYGGEEFLVVLPGISPAQAMQRVSEWQLCLARTPTVLGAFSIHVTLSAGVAGFPYHGADADTLATRADAALYRSKAAGRNRVTCFEPGEQVIATQPPDLSPTGQSGDTHHG